MNGQAPPREPHGSPRSLSRMPPGRCRPKGEARLHAHRATGRHRDHRDFDRPAPARDPEGPRGGVADALPEQSQAVRDWAAPLPRRPQQVPRRDRAERDAVHVALRGTAPLRRAGPALQAVGLRDAALERFRPRGGGGEDLHLLEPSERREPGGPGSRAVRPQHLRRQWRHAAIPHGDLPVRRHLPHHRPAVATASESDRRKHARRSTTARATRSSSANG